MRSYLIVLFLAFSALLTFGESPQYQTATIVEVQTHQPANLDKPAYDVSLRVKNTIYVVLYTPAADTGAAKHAAGREVLILVSEKTIKSNDLLGSPFEMPILSKKTIAAANRAK